MPFTSESPRSHKENEVPPTRDVMSGRKRAAARKGDGSCASVDDGHETSVPGPARNRAGPEASAPVDDSTAASNSWHPPAEVFIKVGNGKYWNSPFGRDELMAMDRGDLLVALASSVLFGDRLKDVALSSCPIGLIKSALSDGKDEPDATDEWDVAKLVTIHTVSDVARAHCTGDRLFIHVRLPPTPSACFLIPGGQVPVYDWHDFQTAMPLAHLKALPHGCAALTLPNDPRSGRPLQWPGLKSNILFIRPIFKRFYEDAAFLGRMSPGNKRARNANKLLRGVPGIGKSSFGLYVLWRLVKAGRTVVYENKKGLGKHVVLAFGPPQPLSKRVYIADGTKPNVAAGAILVISGPHQREIFDVFKNDAQHLYMPQPTIEELLEMRNACFADRAGVSDAEVLERVSRWGCVPRTTLARIYDEQDTLTAAIRVQRVDSLRNLIIRGIETGADSADTFCVIRYAVSEDYRDTTYCWASSYVEQRVVERLPEAGADDRFSLLRHMLRKESTLATAHRLFVDWTNVAMSRGSGKKGFRIRRLGVWRTFSGVDPSAEESAAMLSTARAADAMLGVTWAGDAEGMSREGGQVVIPAATTTVLDAAADLAAHVATAGPRRFRASACSAALDFVEANGACSKATVANGRGLLAQGDPLDAGLYPILARLFPGRKPEDPVPFLWLVPELMFSGFALGSLHAASPPAMIDAPHTSTAAITSAATETAHLAPVVAGARILAPCIVHYVVEIPSPGTS